ncbi:hypothetical protein GCM10010193_67690 [Kitasatospora atroaurantiaca]
MWRFLKPRRTRAGVSLFDSAGFSRPAGRHRARPRPTPPAWRSKSARWTPTRRCRWIAVGGHGAGATLAAAAALRARDRQDPPIRFQLLNQPTLDDRQQTWSARHFTATPFTLVGPILR